AHYAQASVYGLISEDPADYRAQIDDRKRLFTRLFDKAGFPPTGKSVDFGASLGVSVQAAQEMGFEATGVEISARARDHAHQLFGLTLRDGDLDQFDDHSLSLITLFDVLEHIPNPRA